MLTEGSDGIVIAVRVKPRASSARIEGVRAGRLLLAVTAPPLEGRANDAVRRLIAKALGVGTGRVSIRSGERSRDKLVRIEGASAAEGAALLGCER